MDDLHDCPLCHAIKESPGGCRQWNQILLETEHFCLLPCLGPLVKGHIMVVAKRHSRALYLADPTVLASYNRLIKLLRSNPAIEKTGLLEAEHGSSENDLGGGCISHTHVQLIPTHLSVSDLFKSEPFSLVVEELESFEQKTAPYIFLRDSTHTERFLRVVRPGSQTIRKEVARLVGVSQWDWKIDPRLVVIEETVRFWKSLEILNA